jgi:hypothetical protein
MPTRADLELLMRGLGLLGQGIGSIGRGRQARKEREEQKERQALLDQLAQERLGIQKEGLEIRRQESKARQQEAAKGREFRERLLQQQQEFQSGQKAMRNLQRNKERAIQLAVNPITGRLDTQRLKRIAPIMGLDATKDFGLELEAESAMDQLQKDVQEEQRKLVESPAIVKDERGPIQSVFDKIFGGRAPRTQQEKQQEEQQQQQKNIIEQLLKPRIRGGGRIF